MRLFTSESMYNVQSDKWEERFWIDSQLVDGDLYFFELEREKELEIQKLKDEAKEEIDEQCDCPECTINRYVSKLVEMTDGCPECIRQVLEEYLCDIVDHIVIENEEEDKNEIGFTGGYVN